MSVRAPAAGQDLNCAGYGDVIRGKGVDMPIGIHEIGRTGTCRYRDRAIELRGMSGGGLGLSWHDGWRARPEPGDKMAGTRLCQDPRDSLMALMPPSA